MSTKSMVAWAAALLSIAGCGTGDAGQWSGAVRDSAGFTIVENPATGIWTDETRPTYTEELRIGTASGDPAYQFGQITGLDVGSDGSIYVLDQQARTVRVYNADGTHARDIGRPGTGPGELGQVLIGLMLGADNSVLVPDMMQQRVNRYTSDGAPLGEFRIAFQDGIPMRWEQTPDRNIVVQSRRMALPGQAQPQTGGEPMDRIFVRAPGGAILDTMLVFQSGATFDFAGGQPRIRLFESEPVWTIGTDGTLYFGRNAEFNIEVRDAEGTLQRFIRIPFERKPVTEGDRSEFRNLMREAFQQGVEAQGVGNQPGVAEAIEGMVQAIEFAEFYPAFANLMGGPANTLWVQRVRTAQDAAESGEPFNPQAGDTGSRVWDVFDSEGRYLGDIELPAKFNPLHVTGNEIWGVARDDLDVQYVVKLQLTGLGGA